MINTILKSRKITNFTVFSIFVLISLIGFLVYRDYGVSWDEPIERCNGLHSLASAYYVFTRNSLGFDLSKWTDRYYGNGLQHLLLFVDYLGDCFSFNSCGNAESWFLRHKMTFIFMLVGLFFMYRTGCLLWRCKVKAIIPILLFLFLPRFVAESFYNIKDIGLLATMMVGGFFIVRYTLNNTYKNIIFLGIAAAFVCSVRLVGLQLLIMGIFIAVVLEPLCKGKWSWKKTSLHILCLFVSFFTCLILFYPACWNSNVFTFFIDAFSYMTKHPWGGIIRFCGNDYRSVNLPWYYLIVWIGITVPLPVIFLLFIGSISVLKKCFSCSNKRLQPRVVFILLMFFMMFWGELLILPFIVKNYYNGWRHFYFLGYPMLILAGFGAVSLFKIAWKYSFVKIVLITTVFTISLVHVVWMVSQHPYQYLYFNVLASSPANFELDYWHVSNIRGIKKILDRNKDIEDRKTLAYHYTIPAALSMYGELGKEKIHVVSNDSFHDYVIITDDSNWTIEKYRKQYPKYSKAKIIFDETEWVYNSLWTKRGMVYRLVELKNIP